MAIDLKCPCGKRFRVNDQYAGCRVRCPECKRVSRVPRLKPQSESSLSHPFKPKDQGRFDLTVQAACQIGPCEAEVFTILRDSVQKHLELEHDEDCRGSLVVTVTDWLAVENMLKMSLVCKGELGGKLDREAIDCEAKISRISQAALRAESEPVQKLSPILQRRVKGCTAQLCSALDRSAGINTDDPIKWYVPAQKFLIVVAILVSFVACCIVADLSIVEIFNFKDLSNGIMELTTHTTSHRRIELNATTVFWIGCSVLAFSLFMVLQWILLFFMPNRFYTHDPRGRRWLKSFYACTPFYFRINMTLTTMAIFLFVRLLYVFWLKPVMS